MAANQPGFSIQPTSPNPRDDLVTLPYEMRRMIGEDRPLVGERFGDVQWDSRSTQRLDAFENYRLLAVEGGGSDARLIYGQYLEPSAELEADPSESIPGVQMHQWPNVVRGGKFTPIIKDGNLVDLLVEIDEVEATTAPSNTLLETWYTSVPWPEDYIKPIQPQPGKIWWTFPGGFRGQRFCLHHDFKVPAIGGITAIRGHAVDALRRASFEFPKTNFTTWAAYVLSEEQPKVRGRYVRRRLTIFPPFDAATYPPSPRQTSS
jgi:hypothetical protein